MVEQSFGVQITRIFHIVFKQCVREKKEERQKNKIKIFIFDFLNCVKDQWNSGSIFYIRIGKGFHL